MHLAVVSTRKESARKWIPFSVKQRIWAMPCAVCGIPHDIKVDHIVPVACGGENHESNLQPLCKGCNHIKGRRLPNRTIAREVMERGLQHFYKAVFEHVNSYNGYDRRELTDEETSYAVQLWNAFSKKDERCA